MAAPTYTYSSTVFTGQYTNKTIPLRKNLGVVSITSTYTVATVANGNLAAMCVIPAGSTILGAVVSTDKAVAGTTPTIKVGTYDRTTDTTDDDSLILSSTADGAKAFQLSAGIYTHAAITNDLEVFVTLGSGGTPATSMALTVTVIYTTDR